LEMESQHRQYQQMKQQQQLDSQYNDHLTKLKSEVLVLQNQIQSNNSTIHFDALETKLSGLPMIELKELETNLHDLLLKIGQAKVDLVQQSNENSRKEYELLKKQSKSIMDQMLHSKMCKVCEENFLEIVLIPCGHVCLCLACSERIKVCPICRTQADQKLRVYQS